MRYVDNVGNCAACTDNYGDPKIVVPEYTCSKWNEQIETEKQ